MQRCIPEKAIRYPIYSDFAISLNSVRRIPEFRDMKLIFRVEMKNAPPPRWRMSPDSFRAGTRRWPTSMRRWCGRPRRASTGKMMSFTRRIMPHTGLVGHLWGGLYAIIFLANHLRGCLGQLIGFAQHLRGLLLHLRSTAFVIFIFLRFFSPKYVIYSCHWN